MGNRAVLTMDGTTTGIYLHWNGGPESILAFLAVCEVRGYRSPGCDVTYAMARLIGVCHEFFPDGLSLGVGEAKRLDRDNGDNGVYLIGPKWEISARTYSGPRTVEELDERDTKKYLEIVASFPEVKTRG